MEFWRTEHWLEYLLNSKIGTVYIDRSFYLDSKFVPLIQDGCELYSPGFDDDKAILQRVKEIVLENRIKRIQVDSQIKSYLNIGGYTCIINPAVVYPDKGHKAAIKAAQKVLDYSICDTDINKFREAYYKIAGKITRPEKTFEILGKWIAQGYGVLIEAIYNGKSAGYAYILNYNEYAYYFMSCTFPEYRQYNVGHYLQSVVFKYLALKGVKTYELGDQVFDGIFKTYSAKEKNISLFKRGFGGQIIVKPKSELFFDKNYFEETMNQRIQAYKERIL